MAVGKKTVICGVLVLLCLGGVTLASIRIADRMIAPAFREVGPIPADLPGESVRFASASGSDLSGWLVPGTPGGGVVVLMHGVRGDRRHMADRARFLHRQGFGVLLFDFQAHGESTGEYISFGYLESMDAQAAVAYVREAFPGERVGVIGMSLGGAAAALADPPLDIDAWVLELTYTTIEDAVGNRLEMRLGSAGRWLSPLLLWQLRPRLGIKPEQLRPIASIRKQTAPLLMISGFRDRSTTHLDSHRLFLAANITAPKEHWSILVGKHENMHALQPEAYEERVGGFLRKWLREAAE